MRWRNDFSRRVHLPEKMDDPNLPVHLHVQALRGLKRINALTRSAAIMWPYIREIAHNRPIRVLDVASGSGDLLVAWYRLALQEKQDIHFTGCDISATAIQLATEQYPQLRWFQANIFQDAFEESWDVITCSLFCHHLCDDEVVQLLQRFRSLQPQRIIINDLVRCKISYWQVWLATRLLSRSPIVHHDGPVSVRQAFQLPEFAELAEKAGLHAGRLIRKWPCRFLYCWDRPE